MPHVSTMPELDLVAGLVRAWEALLPIVVALTVGLVLVWCFQRFDAR